MDESARQIADEIIKLVTTYGLDVVGAIVILIVGWIAAGWSERAVGRMLGRSSRVDETLRMFFGNMVRYVVLIFTVLAVLDQFGAQTASLLAVFGAGALAIGLALQGTLSNVAAGVMLLIFRPFKIGDYVETAGHGGTVKALSLFVTELATPDNVQILIPNGQVWGSAVENYSAHPTRRVDIVMSIAYDDDIAAAMESCNRVIAEEPRIHAEPEPFIGVAELADSSVNLVLRLWCDASDYWPVKFDLTRKLKERFDSDGLTIPFPQRDLHLIQADD
jgi:small conductance mechanosensitive channel